MRGIITHIQRMSIHDGPGIHSVIFMKGCNIGCKWYHNPEIFSNKGKVEFDKDNCTACLSCISVCFPEAVQKIGREVDPVAVFSEIKQDYKAGGLKYWLLAFSAGVLWYFNVMFYVKGGSNLGKSGGSVGWATMQSLAIIAANIAGILSSEWKGASRKHYLIMFSGMAFLIVGIIIL
jgi:hypothetical protein